MEKTLKINVPDGYVIDEEKSTFENIVFKKVDDVVIKWNKNYCGVEINVDDEHFVVDSNPSYYMNWDDAMRFYSQPHRSHTWKLPTGKQLKVLAKYLDKVNEIIRENNGYEINGYVWSCEEMGDFCAWIVSMPDGYTFSNAKYTNYYVRAVSAL